MKHTAEQQDIKLKTEMQAKYCVYRIKVGWQRYIGVTKKFNKRIESHVADAFRNDSDLKVHKAMRESLTGFSAKIIFHGTEKECYAKEKEWRPQANMELNTAPGGSAEDMQNAVPSQNIYKVNEVRLAKEGELNKTFTKFKNTLIKTDKGDYIDYDSQYQNWKAVEGQLVSAELTSKESAGGWKWIELKHVIKKN